MAQTVATESTFRDMLPMPVVGRVQMTERKFQELALTLGFSTGRLDVEVSGQCGTLLLAIHPRDCSQVFGALILDSGEDIGEFGRPYFIGSVGLYLDHPDDQRRLFQNLGY